MILHTPLIFLSCFLLQASLGQNSDRRWLFQLIGNSTAASNVKEHFFVTTGLMSSSNYFVKNSPIPLINFGKKYYFLVDFYKANFLQAYQFCRKFGMELLRIEDHAENDFFAKYLLDAKIDVWLGASDLAEEGKFVWLSTGKGLTFSSFADKQPDNAGNIEHCVEFTRRWGGNYVWNDIPCKNTLYFVCQVSTCNEYCIHMSK